MCATTVMDLTQMTRGALRQELDKRGLDTDGPRPTLVDRLTQALNQEELDCKDPHDKTELASISEMSVSSVRSNISSLASCRALTAAKVAGLKARAASLKKKHELDKQAVELQAKREDLEFEMELREALARQATFTKMGCSDGIGKTGELINTAEPQVDANTSTVRNTCRATVDELPIRLGSSNHLRSNQQDNCKIDSTHDHVTRLSLPTLEFSTFKGNNEHYPSFMRAFQTNIASRLTNEEEKLQYLLQYTADKPREIVSTCLYLPPEHGYEEARRLLDRRYGNFAQMAVSLVERILEYPIIKSEDVEGLDSFAIHLRGSLNALKSLPHGAGSVDVKTIRALVDKVPYHMKEKWRRAVDGIEQTSFRQATFEDFVDFVEVEARIATNPSYGRIMLGSGSAKGKSRERRSEHALVAGVSSGKLFAGSFKDPRRVSNTCLCCSQEHETHECPELLARTPEDKNRFVFENRLCFGCLTANHIIRFCKERKKCQVCGGLHATVFHRDQERPRSLIVTSEHVAPIRQGGAKLQAVPVRITVYGNSLTTHAFLDSGSTHSFICAPLLRALGISPITNTSITLSTISKDERIDSCVIPHLWIASLDGTFRMELPPLFMLDRIPVTRRDTPGEDDLKKWPYLKESGVTLEDRVDVDVGLLIGSNAAAVTEPLQVVSGQGGGPYAIRTRFGWVLGGVPKLSKGLKINQAKLALDDELLQGPDGTRAVAQMRRAPSELRNNSPNLGKPELSVSEIDTAKTHIIRHVQARCFQVEIKDLKAGRPVRLKSPMVSLDPILKNSLLVTGGRLVNAGLEHNKHPFILPNKGAVVGMIIDDAHEKAGHGGRQHVMNGFRTKYWILKMNSAVRRRLRQCLSCRKRLRPVVHQKMANSPADKVHPGEKPWSRARVDFFGPFYTKRGRALTKKYGVIFICSTIIALHTEVVDSLSTDAFLCAPRRFIARREVRTMRSDNELNFAGANRELKREIDHFIEHGKEDARQALVRGMKWGFNPPGALHFGGAWERLIRSVQKVLNALLITQTLSEEKPRTLLCEVEGIYQ